MPYLSYYITIRRANIIWFSVNWDLGKQAHADPLGIIIMSNVIFLRTKNLMLFVKKKSCVCTLGTLLPLFPLLSCNSSQLSPTPSSFYGLFFFNHYHYIYMYIYKLINIQVQSAQALSVAYMYIFLGLTT